MLLVDKKNQIKYYLLDLIVYITIFYLFLTFGNSSWSNLLVFFAGNFFLFTVIFIRNGLYRFIYKYIAFRALLIYSKVYLFFFLSSLLFYSILYLVYINIDLLVFFGVHASLYLIFLIIRSIGYFYNNYKREVEANIYVALLIDKVDDTISFINLFDKSKYSIKYLISNNFGFYINGYLVSKFNAVNYMDISVLYYFDNSNCINLLKQIKANYNCSHIRFVKVDINHSTAIPTFKHNVINFSELLSREEQDDQIFSEIKDSYRGKSVVIVGGGGSIGQGLAIQLLRMNVSHLSIVDFSELNLFNAEINIKNYIINNQITCEVNFILCDAANYSALSSSLSDKKYNLLIHAAAYKHVTLVQNNKLSAFLNNIGSTINVIKLASRLEIPNMILISSDKAVKPSNFMGLTKKIAELIAYFNSGDVIVSIVRFGNVLNSSGSVIPFFLNQIHTTRTVTVTHPDVTRYFMSIEEAALLVLASNLNNRTHDIFVLDMGEPVKILDLAKKLIVHEGFSINDDGVGDVRIQIIGLRPGEKLHEELFLVDDDIELVNNKLFRVKYTENEFDKDLFRDAMNFYLYETDFSKLEDYFNKYVYTTHKN